MQKLNLKKARAFCNTQDHHLSSSFCQQKSHFAWGWCPCLMPLTWFLISSELLNKYWFILATYRHQLCAMHPLCWHCIGIKLPCCKDTLWHLSEGPGASSEKNVASFCFGFACLQSSFCIFSPEDAFLLLGKVSDFGVLWLRQFFMACSVVPLHVWFLCLGSTFCKVCSLAAFV